MFFVYIIKSNSRGWFYVGMSKNPRNRVFQHNRKQMRSTKNFAPYTLIYTKSFNNRADARDFEKFLKIRSNKEKVLKDLGYLK